MLRFVQSRGAIIHPEHIPPGIGKMADRHILQVRPSIRAAEPSRNGTDERSSESAGHGPADTANNRTCLGMPKGFSNGIAARSASHSTDYRPRHLSYGASNPGTHERCGVGDDSFLGTSSERADCRFWSAPYVAEVVKWIGCG